MGHERALVTEDTPPLGHRAPRARGRTWRTGVKTEEDRRSSGCRLSLLRALSRWVSAMTPGCDRRTLVWEDLTSGISVTHIE